MSTKAFRESLDPSADFCFGRKTLCELLLQVPNRDGAALIFGGLLTGKTTLLRRLESDMVALSMDSSPGDVVTLPVYVDVRSIPEPESPLLFRAMIELGIEALKKHYDKAAIALPESEITLPDFARLLDCLFALAEKLNLRMVYLLDNCDKLATFPGALPGNLAWLIWGSDKHNWRNKISLLLAGGQRMRSLLLDGNSVIGSRSAVYYLDALPKSAVLEMLGAENCPGDRERIGDKILHFTGGHPGLSRQLALEFAAHASHATPYDDLVALFAAGKEGLFERIRSGLSLSAHSIQELFCAEKAVTVRDVRSLLAAGGRDTLTARQALQELLFTGLVTEDAKKCSPACRLYWEYVSPLLPGPREVSGNDSKERKFIFKKNGNLRSLAFGGQVVIVEDSIGLERIHMLLQTPGRWIEVTELLRLGQEPENNKHSAEIARELLKQQGDLGANHGAGTVNDEIDEEYRTQLISAERELKDEIENLASELEGPLAPEIRDEKEAEMNAKEAELEKIRQMLSKTTHRGQIKKFANEDKQAYNAVRKALADAKASIRAQSDLANLANHLEDKIRYETYTYCYAPDVAINWQL